MKYMIRLYRILKPVCIYTSYLFTGLTALCLIVNELTGRRFLLAEGFLWGMLAFSAGSAGLQRLFLGAEFPGRLPYPARLVLYGIGAALWGWACLCVLFALPGKTAAALIVGAGVLCCLGLEIFNRYRAHMYNTLLEQYKRRKRV